MKKCKNCKTKIGRLVKICPNCGKPQLGPWKWVLIAVVIALGITVYSTKKLSAPNKDTLYPTYQVETLFEDLYLESSGKTYQNNFVKLIGQVVSVDPEQDSFSIGAIEKDKFNFEIVLCETNKDISNLKAGDIVSVKAKITKAGTLWGYNANVYEIIIM